MLKEFAPWLEAFPRHGIRFQPQLRPLPPGTHLTSVASTRLTSEVSKVNLSGKSEFYLSFFTHEI